MGKNVALLDFEGNPNIGLYMFVNNKFCLIGCDIDDKRKKEIENTLEVDVFKITALGTELLGVFFTGDDNIIAVPEIFDYELDKLKQICDKYNVELVVVKSKINTLGNNLCFGKNKIIINEKFDSRNLTGELKTYKLIKLNNRDYSSAGGVCRFVNGKFYISQELDENEVKEFIDEIGGIGTVNSGSNFVASGIVGNNNGLLIGKLSSSIEIQNIVECFDFI
jgi:translation initiation factor 6 (eIF-6)